MGWWTNLLFFIAFCIKTKIIKNRLHIWNSQILLNRQILLWDIFLEFFFRQQTQHFCLQKTSLKFSQSKQICKSKVHDLFWRLDLKDNAAAPFMRRELWSSCLSFLNWRILTLDGPPLIMTYFIYCVYLMYVPGWNRFNFHYCFIWGASWRMKNEQRAEGSLL